MARILSLYRPSLHHRCRRECPSQTYMRYQAGKKGCARWWNQELSPRESFRTFGLTCSRQHVGDLCCCNHGTALSTCRLALLGAINWTNPPILLTTLSVVRLMRKKPSSGSPTWKIDATFQVSRTYLRRGANCEVAASCC